MMFKILHVKSYEVYLRTCYVQTSWDTVIEKNKSNRKKERESEREVKVHDVYYSWLLIRNLKIIKLIVM